MDGFAQALPDPATYAAQRPDCSVLNGDFEGGGSLTSADIDGSIAALLAG
jgi:hypothetical protein